MDDIWSLLELEPTADISAIKRAYAKQARKYHPKEDPEGFLRLRQAYQTALDYAENGSASAPNQQADSNAENAPTEPEPEAEPEPEEASEGGWTLEEKPETGPNPYEDGEAIGQFLALYTGKRRRDPKAWMDYFTSPAFLDAAWDGRFTALLLEHVTRLEGETPPSKEFLKWLAVAYQYEATVIPRRGPDGQDAIPALSGSVQGGYWLISPDASRPRRASVPSQKMHFWQALAPMAAAMSVSLL